MLLLLRTDKKGPQVYIQEKRYDVFTPIIEVHQAAVMVPPDCRTVRKLVVFRDDKWSTPNKGNFRIDIFDDLPFSLVTPAIFSCSWQWFKY